MEWKQASPHAPCRIRALACESGEPDAGSISTALQPRAPTHPLSEPQWFHMQHAGKAGATIGTITSGQTRLERNASPPAVGWPESSQEKGVLPPLNAPRSARCVRSFQNIQGQGSLRKEVPCFESLSIPACGREGLLLRPLLLLKGVPAVA